MGWFTLVSVVYPLITYFVMPYTSYLLWHIASWQFSLRGRALPFRPPSPPRAPICFGPRGAKCPPRGLSSQSQFCLPPPHLYPTKNDMARPCKCIGPSLCLVSGPAPRGHSVPLSVRTGFRSTLRHAENAPNTQRGSSSRLKAKQLQT